MNIVSNCVVNFRCYMCIYVYISQANSHMCKYNSLNSLLRQSVKQFSNPKGLHDVYTFISKVVDWYKTQLSPLLLYVAATGYSQTE